MLGRGHRLEVLRELQDGRVVVGHDLAERHSAHDRHLPARLGGGPSPGRRSGWSPRCSGLPVHRQFGRQVHAEFLRRHAGHVHQRGSGRSDLGIVGAALDEELAELRHEGVVAPEAMRRTTRMRNVVRMGRESRARWDFSGRSLASWSLGLGAGADSPTGAGPAQSGMEAQRTR